MAEDESLSPAIYGMELPSRALCARVAETDEIHFLAATQSVTSENQIHLLTYNEDSELDKFIYSHPAGEVWDMTSSPFNRDLIATIHSHLEGGKQKFSASLWTLPDDQETLTEGLSGADDSQGASPRNRKSSLNTAVTKLSDFAELEGRLSAVCWDPKEGSNAIVCVDESTVKLYKLDNDVSMLTPSSVIPTGENKNTSVNAVFNPHLGLIDCIITGEAVSGLDFRVSKPVFSISRPHSLTTRDVNFNPNKPYHVATAGDDCQVKFWDIRQLTAPLITRRDHTHWVWGVQYNPNHDQLVVSCSSDSNVALSRLASIASDPIPILDEDLQDTSPKPPQPDELIMTYDVHEDSVYKVQWSSANSWVFASLSYDGRLAINHVPRSETLKILL